MRESFVLFGRCLPCMLVREDTSWFNSSSCQLASAQLQLRGAFETLTRRVSEACAKVAWALRTAVREGERGYRRCNQLRCPHLSRGVIQQRHRHAPGDNDEELVAQVALPKNDAPSLMFGILDGLRTRRIFYY